MPKILILPYSASEDKEYKKIGSPQLVPITVKEGKNKVVKEFVIILPDFKAPDIDYDTLTLDHILFKFFSV